MSTHPARHAVVTGGTGFVGSHLVERLIDRGDRVTVLDAVAPRFPVEGVRYVTGDLRESAKLAEVIRPGVDVVYHLAAVVGVDQYLARPLDVIDINYAATRSVLDLALEAGAKVVLASTSEVFGKNPAVPWDEAHRPAARSLALALGRVYGRSLRDKSRAEVLRRLAQRLET